MTKSFALFETIFILILDSLLSESVSFTKFTAVVIWSVIFFSMSLTFALQSVFLTKLLTLGILFSTVVNAFFAAKLLISGILFSTLLTKIVVAKLLTSGILFSTVVNAAFVAKLLISGILSFISAILV